MAPRKNLDEREMFPTAVAGIITDNCECGWEIVTIQPEECHLRISMILLHLIQSHGLVMPVINCYVH